MSCGPNRTCHAACDCREAQWAEKLAAANAETTAALAWFKDSEQRLKAAEAERDRAASIAVNEALRTNIALALSVAAEERARRLEEALQEIGKHECRHAKLGDGIDCTRVGMVFPDGFTACPSCIASAALAPPPEAEKRGEG